MASRSHGPDWICEQTSEAFELLFRSAAFSEGNAA